MTFDLADEQRQAVASVRAVALEVVAPLAAAIDADGAIPETVSRALTSAGVSDPFAGGAVSGAAVVEELAAASAGAAAAVGLGSPGGTPSRGASSDLAGLRGADAALAALEGASPSTLERARLALAAVAVGVGRAAVAEAVATMKKRGVRPGGDEPTPYWSLADAATDVEAARLLTMRAADALDRGGDAGPAIALAKGYAAATAMRAVEAAMFVIGPEACRRGALLERLARDARTLTLALGTPEENRASAAREL